jgi:hypothetical protein
MTTDDFFVPFCDSAHVVYQPQRFLRLINGSSPSTLRKHNYLRVNGKNRRLFLVVRPRNDAESGMSLLQHCIAPAFRRGFFIWQIPT